MGNIVLIVIQIIAAIVLFVLIMMQTPKTDGLAAMGGQSSDSEYKGKMGKDEILSNYTKYAAGIFFLVSLLLVVIKH